MPQPHRVLLIIDLPSVESQYSVKHYNSYILDTQTCIIMHLNTREINI